jgi:hypothetical protein
MGCILPNFQLTENCAARFESGIWSSAERKYDAVKLECRGLLKALKKFRFWLYGRYFTIETDAQTLVWLLNQPLNDLPNAMMTRWLHTFGYSIFMLNIFLVTRTVAPMLYRRWGGGLEDLPEDENEADDYFDAKLYSIRASERPPEQFHYGKDLPSWRRI